jgi:hypothetical protein
MSRCAACDACGTCDAHWAEAIETVRENVANDEQAAAPPNGD